MKLKFSSAPLLLSLMLSACTEPANEQEGKVAPALGVTTTQVTQGTLRHFEFAEGTAFATRREFLVFETAGRVAFIKTNSSGDVIREGDRVKGPAEGEIEGELLAQLDVRGEDANVRALSAELESTRARLATARADYERAKRLQAGGAIEERRLDSIKTEYKQARGAVSSAEARLAQARVTTRGSELRAPFDGVVAFSNISEGQYISPGQFDPTSDERAVITAPMVVIDPSAFEITVDLPVFRGAQVKPGQSAYILDGEIVARYQLQGAARASRTDSSAGLFNLLEEAQVTAVSPAINPGDRVIRARLKTVGKASQLTDGSYVTVWIQTAQRDDAIIAPHQSLIRREGETSVFVVNPDSGLVEKRDVIEGLLGPEGIEILSGLKADEQVVTAGRYRLADGMRVNVLPSTALTPANISLESE